MIPTVRVRATKQNDTDAGVAYRGHQGWADAAMAQLHEKREILLTAPRGRR
jgi:hypothetical protein